ncbi:MAG: WG repeat-containing protein [Cyclobacteriaceae bacterium]|nr:WG repeat-containing protein [Cyclobacteriaceae bacterium]
MSRLFACLLMVTVVPALAQTTPEKLSAIKERSKWTKAEQSIRKAMVKDSLNPEPIYLMAVFFLNSQHPTYQIDSASIYQRRAASAFQGREKTRKPVPDSLTLVTLRSRIDSIAFETAKNVETEEGYQHFIDHYATAVQLPSAVELRDELAFLKALKANTAMAFRDFMSRYPSSHRKTEAQGRMEKLEFDEVTRDKRLASYARFYKEFPKNPYRPLAEKHLFELMTSSGSPRAFQQFITSYPESRWVNRARSMLFELRREGETVSASWLNDSLKRQDKVSTGYWVPVIKSGLYGFIDERGTEVIAPKFEQIPEGYRCGEIEDRYLVTSRGLLARNGSLVWKGPLKDFDDLGLGFIFIATDSGGVVIHESGFRMTNKSTDDAMVIANRFVAINQNDEWTIHTLTGRALPLPSFDEIEVLDSVVQLTVSRKRILTTPGRMARSMHGGEFREDFTFDETRQWGEQQYWVRNGVLEGVINANLHFIVPLDRQALRKTSFGFVTTKGESAFVKGVKKLEGKPYKLVAEQGGFIRVVNGPRKHSLFDKGLGWIEQGDSVWFQGQLGFLQRSDSVLAFLPSGQRIAFVKGTPFQFKEYKDSVAWMVLEEKKKKVVYDAASGVKLFTGEFDQLEAVSPSLFILTKAGKKGIFSEDGKAVLPQEYDAIVPSGDFGFSLLKDKKFGWFDARTRQLIKPVYDRNVKSYNTKLSLAFRDIGYGFILPDGKSLGPHTWDDVQYWNDSVAWVMKGNTWKLIDIATQKVRLDNVKSFRGLHESVKERVTIVQQDKSYGVISNRKGIIIPIQYTDLINLGTREVPLYFTERRISEAELSVVVYFDQSGKVIRRQAMEEDEFDKIACDN